jgi:arginyl-tRNA synthetase
MQEAIKQAIDEALTTLDIVGGDFAVDHPTDKNTGADYFSNVALVVSKQAGQAPRIVAEQLASALAGTIPQVAFIAVAGPGFLNFTLKRDFFVEKINAIINDEEHWGKNVSHKDEVVMVEYTSPNLFKPLHVGNLVGNIIGESLTRLFEYNGATVKRLNYPSDIGLTVAKAVWGLKKTGGNPEDINALGEAYKIGNEAYEHDEAAQAEIVAINQALYEGSDEELSGIRARGIATSKRQLDAICERLGTTFDAVVFESEAAPTGTQIVKDNLGKIFVESNGAVVYEGEKVGLHTRVFLNSKGLPTYEAKDLGNFAKKHTLFPNWNTSIIVTGNEQTEYFKVLYAAIKELYPETATRSLEHIPTGFLTLTTGKMSSRKGNVLTGESLLAEMEDAAREKAAETRTDDIEALTEQVAVAALKYQILRQGVGSNIVFDKERALSFEGDSGPYLQYTNARINSVLQKAADAGVDTLPVVIPEEVYLVETLVYQFPEIIASALHDRAPHKVAGYLTELAGAFNSFYAVEKIADVTDEYAPYKVAIATAVAATLKNGLWVLGIKAPERM